MSRATKGSSVPFLILTSCTRICDRFWENRPKRGKQFFSVSPGKALWVDFFRKIFMAEMDRRQLALAYDAVVISGVL